MKSKKVMRRLLIGMVFGVSVVLTACGTEAGQKTDEQKSSAQKEQDKDGGDSKKADTKDNSSAEPVFGTFSSKTLAGEDISQDIFADADLTMVNIWGTFCGPCIREMPDLGELNREYADKGFQIVGLISDVSEAENETAQEIVDTTKADYTHIVVSQDLSQGILSRVQVVPTTIFVDKEGKQVGSVYSGAKDKSGWEEIITELLGEVQA